MARVRNLARRARVYRIVSKGLWCAMIAGSVATMIFAGRQQEAPAATIVPRAHERPWLSPQAAQLIIGPRGKLGPIFNGLSLGGPEPSAEDRQRIATFARANDVDIRFEVKAGELVAIRFSVTFGGCCGYEGADSLATRLERPRAEYRESDWVNDWSIVADDGTNARTHVHVDRLDVRWEQTLSLDDMLDRAEQLVGKDRASARLAAADRWVQLDFGARDRLELPYPYVRNEYSPSVAMRGEQLGLALTTTHGRISEISFTQRNADGDDIRKAVMARWGRPQSETEREWTWKKHGHSISVDPESYVSTVVIRAL